MQRQNSLNVCNTINIFKGSRIKQISNSLLFVLMPFKNGSDRMSF